MSSLSKDLLNELFEYRDGVLYWNTSCGSAKAGNPAGSINGHGYLYTKINKTLYPNHRLIFMMHHGYLPPIVDHIDRIPTNNKIDNLRPATKSQNARNHKDYSSNKSGYTGVTYKPKHDKWCARGWINKKCHHLGWFADIESAIAAVKRFREEFQDGFMAEVSNNNH